MSFISLRADGRPFATLEIIEAEVERRDPEYPDLIGFSARPLEVPGARMRETISVGSLFDTDARRDCINDQVKEITIGAGVVETFKVQIESRPGRPGILLVDAADNIHDIDDVDLIELLTPIQRNFIARNVRA